jgi:uncharacterized protein YggU (UPF0235/DUF167 family)
MQLKIKVTANAKHDSIEKTQKGLSISVRAKPENNMANDRVRELLAIHFEVPINKVKIVRGHKMSAKTIEIFE